MNCKSVLAKLTASFKLLPRLKSARVRAYLMLGGPVGDDVSKEKVSKEKVSKEKVSKEKVGKEKVSKEKVRNNPYHSYSYGSR